MPPRRPVKQRNLTHRDVQRRVISRPRLGLQPDRRLRPRLARQRHPEVELAVLMTVIGVGVRPDEPGGRPGLEPQRRRPLIPEPHRLVLVRQRPARRQPSLQLRKHPLAHEGVEGLKQFAAALVSGDHVREVRLSLIARARLAVPQRLRRHDEVLQISAPVRVRPASNRGPRALQESSHSRSQVVHGAVVGDDGSLHDLGRERPARSYGSGIIFTSFAVPRRVLSGAQRGGTRDVRRIRSLGRGRHLDRA